MIIDLDADAALGCAAEGRLLICFAKTDQLLVVAHLLARYEVTHGIKAVRVEPSVANAEMLQLSRYPTFSLYDDGAETFCVVGHEKLDEALRRTIR